MSHTEILDMIRQRFVKLGSVGLRSKPSLENAANTRKSRHENSQESHFNCKAFLNVSAEMISEFFE